MLLKDSTYPMKFYFASWPPAPRSPFLALLAFGQLLGGRLSQALKNSKGSGHLEVCWLLPSTQQGVIHRLLPQSRLSLSFTSQSSSFLVKPAKQLFYLPDPGFFGGPISSPKVSTLLAACCSSRALRGPVCPLQCSHTWMPPAKDPPVFCQLIFEVTWVTIVKETKLPGSCFNLQDQLPLALTGGILCAEHSNISALSQAGCATGTEHHFVDAALLSVPPDSYLKLSQPYLHGLQPLSDCSINVSITIEALETHSKNLSPPPACFHVAGEG